MTLRKQLCVALAILLPALPLAAAGGSTSVNFSQPILAAGKALAPGQYLLRWKSSSPEAIVKFEKNGTIVAEVNAKVIEREKESPHDSILAGTNASGELVLREVRLRGKKQVLVFE